MPEGASRIAFLLRFLAVLLTVVTVGLLASWLVLGLTVLPTARAGSQMWLVQRAAYPKGQVPAGITVLVLPTPLDRDYSSRFGLLFGDGAGNAIVTVVAAPYTTVSTGTDNHVIVNGTRTDFVASAALPPTTLGDQYLALCQRGPCGPEGTPVIVATDHVLGKVLGDLHPFGLGPVPGEGTSSE